jgi:glycosyltransferase involved in cell wall biosynthesis
MQNSRSSGCDRNRLGIIYVSVGYPKIALDNLVSSGGSLPMQALRFHRLLASGLAACPSVDGVEAIALPPVPLKVRAGAISAVHDELDEGVHYRYLDLGSIPLVRQLRVFAQTASAVWGVCARTRGVSRIFVLTDALNLSASLAARMVSSLFGVHCVGIVTDVPLSMHRMAHPRATFRALGSLAMNVLRTLSMRMFDGFVLLTPQMNEAVNRRGRPFTVIEGFIEARTSARIVRGPVPGQRTVVMFAGGIDRVNGVDRLIEAFEGISDQSLELWLFGRGELSDWAAIEVGRDPRIKVRGLVPPSEVMRAEREADLLVNPRPTAGEYTLYSFPSKNLEYMASGTPLLSTRLAGIPADHYPHFYAIDDDSVGGLRRAMEKVLSLPPVEREALGAAARDYCLREKTNVRAAGRLVVFLETRIIKRRKLLFVAPLPPPVFGQSIAAARLLAALGGPEKCAVVDYNRQGLARSATGLSELKDAVSFVLRVRRHARTASLAYMHLSQSIVGNLRDLTTMFLCRRLPLVVHLHGGGIREAIFDRHRVLRILNRRAYRRVDTVIVLGSSLRRIFKGMVDAKRIEVVANFAPAASFASNAEIDAKFGGSPLKIIFLSNMIEGKGYEEAARALLSLSGELDFEAWFIGPFDAPAKQKKFLEMIAPCPSILYLGGMGDERFEHLKKSHLFLLPAYLPEGQPLSILEAYAAGNFVITTNQGGIRDVFRDGTNGFEVESRSVKDIADKIRLYAGLDRQERLSFARRNRDFAAASFREDVHVDALLRILRPQNQTQK